MTASRILLLLGFGWSLGVASGGSLSAQERPDSSVVVDSLAVDSLAVDSLAALPDSLRPDSLVADSLQTDTIFYNLPQVARGVEEPGFSRGIWHWSHEEIMASGANTLVELVAHLPGMVPLRGGDYGTPLGLSAFGLGGGGLRVLRDGVEILSLEAGVPDLQRVGLGGVKEVRLERHMGEVVIQLTSWTYDDPRAYSLVEAGTGDLDTNIFRGTFADPTTLGGSVALALERTDTRGPAGEETGNRNGAWVRYQLHRGDRAGLAVNFQRMNTETEVEDYAAATTRTDWNVRGSALLLPGVVADGYYARATYEVDDPRDRYAQVGGTRSQMGGRVSWEHEGLFARGGYRRYDGEALPANRWEVAAGGVRPGLGGVSAAWERAAWGDEVSPSHTRLQAWTAPVFGFSLFASRESGSWGARSGPLTTPLEAMPDSVADPGTDPGAEEPDTMPVPPAFRVSERTATRYGAQWMWRDVALSGAYLEMEVDSLLPTGLEFDQGGDPLPGGTRTGWEGWARIPLPIMDGLTLEGSYQQWDEDLRWRYLPQRIYRGAFVYHNTFLETGNLELRGRLGVRGRGPMDFPRFAEGEEGSEADEEVEPVLETVPFYQNWYAQLQVRIVTVRIFIAWENVAVRRNLQDVPGRVLPVTRAFYGIRWTLWN